MLATRIQMMVIWHNQENVAPTETEIGQLVEGANGEQRRYQS